MLLENFHGMIAKSRVQIVELAALIGRRGLDRERLTERLHEGRNRLKRGGLQGQCQFAPLATTFVLESAIKLMAAL